MIIDPKYADLLFRMDNLIAERDANVKKLTDIMNECFQDGQNSFRDLIGDRTAWMFQHILCVDMLLGAATKADLEITFMMHLVDELPQIYAAWAADMAIESALDRFTDAKPEPAEETSQPAEPDEDYADFFKRNTELH